MAAASSNWSPEQISARLTAEFPGRAEMRVSPETIYQSLYVQGRGALRRELARHLRTGRALRRPAGRRGSGAGGSRARCTSASGPRKRRTGRFPGTGKGT